MHRLDIVDTKYLMINYDLKHNGSGILLYNFIFRKCIKTCPIEFHVLDYVAIDGKRIKEKQRIHRPAFDTNSCKFKTYLSFTK